MPLSISPSQLSSMPLQSSAAPGFPAALSSSQSPVVVTLPIGGLPQPWPDDIFAPMPSPSLSGYQVTTARPSSMLPSQLSSRPLQTSAASGCTSGSASLQSTFS